MLEKKEKPFWSLLAVLLVICLLVGCFADLYYGNGSAKDANFICASQPPSASQGSQALPPCRLSRWGAIYFTIGTLSTSGTGNFTPTRYARTIQGIQMILDMVVILFALTAVVSRLVSSQTGLPGTHRDYSHVRGA